MTVTRDRLLARVRHLQGEQLLLHHPGLQMLLSEVVAYLEEQAQAEADRPALRLDEVSVSWEEGEEPDTVWCQALAQVSYPIGDGHRRLEHLRSGGVSVGCPTTPAFRRQVEAEELAELCDHLAVFGVDVSEFDAKVKR